MRLCIRTLTAGVPLDSAADLERVEAAGRFLAGARRSFEAAGYQVETARIATQPLAEYAPDWAAETSLEQIATLDRLAVEHDLLFSIGPVLVGDEYDERFPAWAAELVCRTRNTSLSVSVASPEAGAHRRSVRAAGEAIAAIAGATADGGGNFRFAAAARVPAGTPFFPVAWFRDANTFSLGVESAGLVQEVFAETSGREEAKRALRRRLDDQLAPIAEHAREIGRAGGRRFLGIDVSPAPSPAASIGEAIETLTGAPFGDPSTLAGCAAITEVLYGLEVETCGYSGLMLPMLEDKVLARRAAEGRFGVSSLLLYSSVCGTGLDVVPLPGDTSKKILAALIGDVAALAARLRKPLAARLLPIPGMAAGDVVRIDNPHLTEGVVMDPGS